MTGKLMLAVGWGASATLHVGNSTELLSTLTAWQPAREQFQEHKAEVAMPHDLISEGTYCHLNPVLFSVSSNLMKESSTQRHEFWVVRIIGGYQEVRKQIRYY